MLYETVVGNVGTVYIGGCHRFAEEAFTTHVRQSKTGNGRAGGEDVTILRNGNIIAEYIGTIAQCLADDSA